MTRQTVDRIIDWLTKTEIPIVDLTGGAPEMIPDFRYFLERVTALVPSRHVIDRCNLTILLEPGYEDLPEFLAAHKVERSRENYLRVMVRASATSLGMTFMASRLLLLRP